MGHPGWPCRFALRNNLPLFMTSQQTTTDVVTPKYTNSTVLDSPMEEPPDPLLSMDEAMHGVSQQPEERPHTVTPSETMRPPPLPAHVLAAERKARDSTSPATTRSSVAPQTSPEEAQRALEVVLGFLILGLLCETSHRVGCDIPILGRDRVMGT